MSLPSGSRLGSHEIIGLIGAGGMGEVYLAQDTKLNRRVAIKVLPEAYAADPERVARFLREAQAVAALNHAGIAAIYDLAETSPADASANVRYFVLELVEGDTLADRLSHGPVPVEEALGIAKQILEALEAAHEKGICHRDLKPANVKLTPDGTIKVLDFGLAKFLQTGPSSPPNLTYSPTLTLAATMQGVIVGTAAYMSPEQAKGVEADQRSDIFSFGCILFELLTGRQAFEGETVSEVLASVLKNEPDFSLLPPRLNPRLIELLRRCLEKNPKKRWHAAADVRVELESLMGRALIIDEPRVIEVAQRPLWKRATALIAAAVLGGAAAGYIAWRLKPEPARIVTRFSVLLPQGEQFTSIGRQLIALSPDGRNFVYLANQALHLRALSGLESQLIPGGQRLGGITNPVFSPDGREVAFWAQGEGKLKRLPITGGAPVTISDASNPLGMSWSEDGIVFGQAGKGIVRVSPNGGQAEVIAAEAADETTQSPQLLPGGRAVLFSVKKRPDSWAKGQIVVQRLGDERRILVNGGADARYLPTGHLVYALGGTLLGVPFDVDKLAVSGGPVPLVEGVQRALGTPRGATAQISFSATGTLVYLPGPIEGTDADDGTDLALFDRKGGIEPLKLPKGPYAAPRVSRDGKWVAFERVDETQTSIWTYELAGGHAAQQLTFGGNNRAPIWSPEGQWIAFQSDREGDTAIFRQRADGSGTAERLTKADNGAVHVPQSWSPDGAYILFAAGIAGNPEAWTLNVLTMKDRQIVRYGDIPAREAVFSPDGRWVAYQMRNPMGAANSAINSIVSIEPFPRTGARYQVPFAGGHPMWSPKGDEIVLNVASGRSSVISVTTAPRFALGQPRDFPRKGRTEANPGTTRRTVDMMPDGRVAGILATQVGVVPEATGTTAGQIIVVLNWFDDVRERVRRN